MRRSAVRGRPRRLPGELSHVPGARGDRRGRPLRRVGAGRDRAARGVRAGRPRRLPRDGGARALRRRGRGGLPLQPGHRRGDPARRRGRLRAGDHAAQRHLPALLPELLHRGAARALAGRDRLRRADHGARDDRARHRLGPRGDVHARAARRRPLRRRRRQDVHHQRHQRRPGDRGREDRPRRSAIAASACSSSSAAWRASSGGATSRRSASTPRTPPSCPSPSVRVPVENLLGEEGEGFRYLVSNLPQERLSIAASAVAAAEAALGMDARVRPRAPGLRPADRHLPELALHPRRAAHAKSRSRARSSTAACRR